MLEKLKNIIEYDPFNLRLRVERMEAEYQLDTLKGKNDGNP